MEKIIRIEEKSFGKEDWNNKSGFQIVTNEQTIKLGIDNSQCCCENFGYFMSEDDLSEFIGASILDISVVDEQLKPHKDFDGNNMYEGGVMFVNITTSAGLLQFVAYNEHNGYYGHEACVISKQLNHEECL